MNNRTAQVYDAGSAQGDRDFPHYAPAYQFGNWLASQTKYGDREWEEIEDAVRREWEETHARPWEEYAALVRLAWAETRDDSRPLSSEASSEASGEMFDDVSVDMPVDMPVDVEGGGYPPDSPDYDFQQHFAQNYAARGHAYRDVAPAYHFGYDLAVDSRYRGREWEEIRAQAEERWNKYGVNFFWDAAEPAIVHAWRTTRAKQPGHDPHTNGSYSRALMHSERGRI